MANLQEPKYAKAVSEALLNAGIRPSSTGFAYLKFAVCRILEEERPLKLSTRVYPETAERFGVKPAAVERAIRLAIEQAADSGNWREMDEMLHGIYSPDKGKPTNAEFIFGLAEHLRNTML